MKNHFLKRAGLVIAPLILLGIGTPVLADENAATSRAPLNSQETFKIYGLTENGISGFRGNTNSIIGSNTYFTFNDGQYHATYSYYFDGTTTLTIRAAAGDIIYSGPTSTDVNQGLSVGASTIEDVQLELETVLRAGNSNQNNLADSEESNSKETTSSSDSSSSLSETSSSSTISQNNDKQETKPVTSGIPQSLVGTWTADGSTITIREDGSGSHTDGKNTNQFNLSKLIDQGNGVYEIVDDIEGMKFLRPFVWGLEGPIEKVTIGFILNGDNLTPYMKTISMGGEERLENGRTFTRQSINEPTTPSSNNGGDTISNPSNTSSESNNTDSSVSSKQENKQGKPRKVLPNTGEQSAVLMTVSGLLIILGILGINLRKKATSQ
ncbi:LPXTG cell wall anchor domain-containing protein [Streptococcus sp. NLN64]|uniref:LPXTG cell wall anchor domain-containing protein n=1 Tax=Streptococcus sp. NLN64 TaxID=2822799 RepID=UPI0018C9867E|nr:LPXTG cell wall anchor domain-containing protein [Streptococcus sp. NLN64]MBG9368248.1 LPXTG cell wall anchor domain-containing protein [Streptococcus sp. NLN64]